MILFAFTDVFWQALIAAIVTIVIAWMQQRTKNEVKKASGAAIKHAKETKTVLEANVKQTNEKLNTAVEFSAKAARRVEAVRNALENRTEETDKKLKTVAVLSHQSANNVEEIRQSLTANTRDTLDCLDKLNKLGVTTHLLINLEHEQLLILYAASARSKYNITNDPEDLAKATKAEQNVLDHISSHDVLASAKVQEIVEAAKLAEELSLENIKANLRVAIKEKTNQIVVQDQEKEQINQEKEQINQEKTIVVQEQEQSKTK